MTVVNPKSISGINSITTGSGSDNLLTIHTSDASNTERFRIDSTGTTKIVTGIVTTLTANTTTLNSTTTATGNINVSGANITLQDSGGASDDRLTFGAGTDLSIYHNGSDSYIEDSGTGALVVKTSQLSIRNAADDEQLAKFIQDSGVELYHNGTKKIETTSTGITISGSNTTGSVVQGDFRFKNASGTQHIVYDASESRINFADSINATFGDANDLKIYHDGSHSYIANTTNNLYVNAPNYIQLGVSNGGEKYLTATENGAVQLYHDNDLHLETHANGAQVRNAGADCQFYISAADGYSAVLNFLADNGDDYADYSRIYKDQSGGNLHIQNYAGGSYEDNIVCRNNAEVELYYDNTERLTTTSSGISVKGKSFLCRESGTTADFSNVKITFYQQIAASGSHTFQCGNIYAMGTVTGFGSRGPGASNATVATGKVYLIHIRAGATAGLGAQVGSDVGGASGGFSWGISAASQGVTITNNDSTYALNMFITFDLTGFVG